MNTAPSRLRHPPCPTVAAPRFRHLWLLLIGLGCGVASPAADLPLTRPDLSPPAHVGQPQGTPIELIRDGHLTMPIVLGAAPRVRWGAEFLADIIADMTGHRPQVVVESSKTTGPAVYVGDLLATRAAGFSTAGMKAGEFAVKTKDGSLYLFGNDSDKNSFGSTYAAYDFCERILDARQYFDPAKGGRAVVPTQNLTIPALDYGDAPMFQNREIWPYLGRRDLQTWRSADTYPLHVLVHAPKDWYQDPDYLQNRLEIFHQDRSGKRATSPMLCYGNPRTLATYLERIDEELKGGRKSGIIDGNAVTVSPWDSEVDCRCKECAALLDAAAGNRGSASRLVSTFVRRLSDALATRHPELSIIYLPYLNYVDVPAGIEFPAGNVHVQLCSLPGLAMFKEPEVKAHEEALMRKWAAVTGNKIINWHYICWPAEFTNAPYLYADTIVRHYQDTQDVTVGSFINGWFNPEPRHFLSAYVWCRTLWNCNLAPQAVLDEFSRRMFGPADQPMRQLMRMQEQGWNRHWPIAQLAPKNIYETSYPRHEVVEMEKLFAKAYDLAGADGLIKKRIDYYHSGFTDFFKESKEYAEGTAFAPLMIQKVGANPVVDGKLDDEQWKGASGLSLIRGTDKKRREAYYPTTVMAVWTPEGVTFGFRMTEPSPDKLYVKNAPGTPESWGNDNVELLFDVTGKGEGDYFHIIFDAQNQALFARRSTDPEAWQPAGLRKGVQLGQDYWSAEMFIAFADLRSIKDAQLPKTSSAGLFWIGNFTRHRVADSSPTHEYPHSVPELQRLNTRYSTWNADQSAFGLLKFKE